MRTRSSYKCEHKGDASNPWVDTERLAASNAKPQQCEASGSKATNRAIPRAQVTEDKVVSEDGHETTIRVPISHVQGQRLTLRYKGQSCKCLYLRGRSLDKLTVGLGPHNEHPC